MGNHKKLANIIYGATMVFALGVLAKVYFDRASLPSGVCPADHNAQWLYLAIGLLVVGTVISSLLERRHKKTEQHKELK